MSKFIPAIIIFLLLTSCESLTLLNQTSVTDGDNVTIDQVDVPEDATWAKITMDKVEEICLDEAKREAGRSAWAVKDCLCEELTSNGMKQYYCDVYTLDPSGTAYWVKLSCFLEGRTCNVQSNYGTETLTFEELEERYD